MQNLVLTSKRKWLIGLFLLSAVSVISVAEASPYIINKEVSFAYHWDEYVYRYTPGAGWAGTIESGNNAESSSVLEVLAKDGSIGQLVDLKLSFKISWGSNYHDYGMDPDEMNNFAGSSGVQISNNVTAWNAHFQGASFNENITKPFDTFGSHVSTITVPFVVGPLVLGPFDDGRFTDVSGHMKFILGDLFVHDPTKPAAAGFAAEIAISLIDAEVVGVPEGGNMLLVISGSLAGLLCFKRRRIVAP